MSKKIIYFDTETTGLDPVKNDIIQLAGIIVVDSDIKEEFNFQIMPMNFESIQEEAITTHGITIDEMKRYPDSNTVYKQFIAMLGKYVDKYNKEDKFTPAGYNVDFDINFLNQYFIKNMDVYYGSWFNWKRVDPLPLLYFLNYCNQIDLPNYKLSTVCEHFDIPINAHDALSDIYATRTLLRLLYKKFFNN